MRQHLVFDIGRIAATYIGTIIGAGFASGQELLQFFVAYGSIGLAGLVFAGILLAWLGYLVLSLGSYRRFSGYDELFYYVCGSRLGLILDVIISISLFGMFSVMLAGAGMVSRDYLAVDYTSGLLLFTLIVCCTVLGGVRGIAAVNMLVTPLLILATVLTVVYSLFYHHFDVSLLTISSVPEVTPVGHWLLSSLSYVSYNMVFSTTVLVPLSVKLNPRSFALGSICTGIILVILAVLVCITMMLHHPHIWYDEMPMLLIASSQFEWNRIVYATVLILAMYTTAIAGLYASVTKLQTITGLNSLFSMVLITIGGIALSNIGFKGLIALIYPLFGYAALFFTLFLICQTFRRR